MGKRRCAPYSLQGGAGGIETIIVIIRWKIDLQQKGALEVVPNALRSRDTTGECALFLSGNLRLQQGLRILGTVLLPRRRLHLLLREGWNVHFSRPRVPEVNLQELP